MDAAMATRPASVLRRDTEHRVLGGVCAGLARHFGVDPLIVRVAFVAAATAGGIGIAIYAIAWVFVPAGSAPGRTGRLHTGRGTIEIALGIAFLALSVLLTFRALGVLFSDAVVWPLTLVAAGAALLWRAMFGGRAAAGGAWLGAGWWAGGRRAARRRARQRPTSRRRIRSRRAPRRPRHPGP